MQYFFLLLLILRVVRNARGFFSTVQCPAAAAVVASYTQTEALQFHELNLQQLDCTLVISCSEPYGVSGNAAAADSSSLCPEDKFQSDNFLYDCFPENGETCEMKLKVTVVKNWNYQSLRETPCPSVQQQQQQQQHSVSNLLPFPGNCSLFYKCDWGSAVLFECPADLHFNPQLQVCDWPWQAQCDSSWTGCPRPHPTCPENYPRPLYLPHPRLCDHFYQCEWGIPRLHTCPTGLHFDPTLKICDWPYRANCQVC